MKQKYPWFIAVSALLVAGALSSCESDASFGSQEVEVVPGPSNSELDPDDSYSSSQTSGSSSSTNMVYCDFGDGDCTDGYTAIKCGEYGGDVVTTCPVTGSSSSASSTDIGCLIEMSGQSNCTMMSEVECEAVANYYLSYSSVTVTKQNNCD